MTGTLKGLTINRLGKGLILSLALVGIITIFTNLFMVREVEKLSSSWANNEQSIVQKQAYLSVLRGAIGYGGMIHNFKNYLLRQDKRYLLDTHRSMLEIKIIISGYRLLGVSSEEDAALGDLENVVKEYGVAIALAELLLDSSFSILETDSQVYVDDGPAVRALLRLTDAVATLRQVKTNVDSGQIHSLANTINSVTIGIGLLLIIMIVSLTWFLRFRLLKPLDKLSTAFDQVDPSAPGLTRLPSAGNQGDELDMVANAGNRFLDSIENHVNERLYAEKALRDREQRMGTILSNVVDGIITIDNKGTIETFNPASERLFGYRADEVIGKNIKCLMPQPYRDKHDGYLQNYHDTNEAKIIGIGREVIGQRKDGSTFPMDLAVGEMEVSGIQMFTGIVRDITDRQQAEMMKTEFVSTVSHELRTPLTSIKGSLGLVQSGALGELPDKLKSMISIAYTNCDRLVRLINDILDIEKIAAGKMDFHMRPINLVPLLEQAMEANKGYGEEHDVSFYFSSDLPEAMVEGDHDRLMQVLANLMSNAAKFSPIGGNVRITLSKHDAGFRVAVADKGPGIPEEFRNKIFGKFHQADSSDTRQKGGTGLGLNISKAIVERHDGIIGFESKAGQGSTFFVDLPELQGNTVFHSRVSRLPLKYHVLICEDDPDNATLLELLLKQDGFTTDIARNAAEAEEFLGRTAYDAMTLDLCLPGKDGITLLRELRENPKTRDLPVIVISATATEGAADLNGDAIGVIDWLDKPIDQNRLSAGLRRILTSSTEDKVRILHVEDDPDVLQVVSALVDGDADIVPAKTLSMAKSLLLGEAFDLVILDLMLPDGDGEELLALLKREDHKPTPVIVFSARDAFGQTAENIKATLVKSKTSNEFLLATIRASIKAEKPPK